LKSFLATILRVSSLQKVLEHGRIFCLLTNDYK
jgi:hypothetical protein